MRRRAGLDEGGQVGGGDPPGWPGSLSAAGADVEGPEVALANQPFHGIPTRSDSYSDLVERQRLVNLQRWGLGCVERFQFSASG